VLQRAEQRIDIEQVGGVKAAATAIVADQVMALRAEATGHVGAVGCCVASDDGVAGVERGAASIEDAAAIMAKGDATTHGSAGNGVVGYVDRPAVVADAAARGKV